MVKQTQIQVTDDTKELLKSVRITKRESYDEIINRLIKKQKPAEG